ncbi:hypothetical protein FRB99_003392 [Tulasnella sp. 403]|nr:hypothetical protein FRB99_003392 [Tulasnella sp. 403]
MPVDPTATAAFQDYTEFMDKSGQLIGDDSKNPSIPLIIVEHISRPFQGTTIGAKRDPTDDQTCKPLVDRVFDVIVQSRIDYAEKGGRVHPLASWDDIGFDEAPNKAYFTNWPQAEGKLERWIENEPVDQDTRDEWLQDVRTRLLPTLPAYNGKCNGRPPLVQSQNEA